MNHRTHHPRAETPTGRRTGRKVSHLPPQPKAPGRKSAGGAWQTRFAPQHPVSHPVGTPAPCASHRRRAAKCHATAAQAAARGYLSHGETIPLAARNHTSRAPKRMLPPRPAATAPDYPTTGRTPSQPPRTRARWQNAAANSHPCPPYWLKSTHGRKLRERKETALRLTNLNHREAKIPPKRGARRENNT